MQDHHLSNPSQESQPQLPGDRTNQSRPVPLTLMSNSQGNNCTQAVDEGGRRKNKNSPQTGPWGKVSSPQTTREAEFKKSTNLENYNKETPGRSQAVCVPRQLASFSKQDTAEEGDQLMDEGELNQSQKSKRSRNRRQRRKGSSQHIVGLPCSPSLPPPVLLWVRRDLRLCDNPALCSSLEMGAPVIPVFIWSPEEEEGPGITVAMGGACKLTEEPVVAFIFKIQCITVIVYNHAGFFLQVNTGFTKLCLVSVHLWSTLAAILSSSRPVERGMKLDVLCIPLKSW